MFEFALGVLLVMAGAALSCFALSAAAVGEALRALPSHGWTRGMFGRRGPLPAGAVPAGGGALHTPGRAHRRGRHDGAATITTPALTWTLRPADDSLLCGPCAVARWLRILNLVVTRPSHADIAQVLKKAKPGNSGSPHLCRTTRALDDATLRCRCCRRSTNGVTCRSRCSG